MSKIIRVLKPLKDSPDSKHMVIGNQQIRNCWDFIFENTDLNFPIEWICNPDSDATPEDFMSIVINEIIESKTPFKISAMIWAIWQNVVPFISLDKVKDLVAQAENCLYANPGHSIAFPEMMFFPRMKAHYEKIRSINLTLASFNRKWGFNRYSLHKAGSSKGNWGYDGLFLCLWPASSQPAAQFLWSLSQFL